MFEIDFLPVGDGERSGDAIAMRFTRPDTGGEAVIVVDAGFKDDGEELARLIPEYYGTDRVDLAVLTHPDGDHIGGMGEVIRGLNVQELWTHGLGGHGGGSLEAADAVDDLMAVAVDFGVTVTEPWAGEQRFGGAFTLLGPTETYYDELVSEQLAPALSEAASASRGSSIMLAAKSLVERLVVSLPIEIPFEAKDVSPRNNTSMITMLKVDAQTNLLTGDAGVPALEKAWGYAEAMGLDDTPTFIQIPHHGSRRNCSSTVLDRVIGPTGQVAGERAAFVSCVAKSDKHPSGRVVNAYMRRGSNVVATAGSGVCNVHGVPFRPGWGPVDPLGPMEEEDE